MEFVLTYIFWTTSFSRTKSAESTPMLLLETSNRMRLNDSVFWSPNVYRKTDLLPGSSRTLFGWTTEDLDELDARRAAFLHAVDSLVYVRDVRARPTPGATGLGHRNKHPGESQDDCRFLVRFHQ